MRKETFITVLITFAVTSLLWFFVFFILIPGMKSHSTHNDSVTQPTAQHSDPTAPSYQVNAKHEVDYNQSIIGHWDPVEVSETQLDFSEYGTMKATSNKYNHPVRTDYKYKLLGDRMGYTLMVDFYEGDWHRIEITTDEDGDTYLSIFDDPELGGRYRKR